MNRNQQNVLQCTPLRPLSLKVNRNLNSINSLSDKHSGNQEQLSELVERCPSHLEKLVAENDGKQQGKQPTVGVLFTEVSKSVLQLVDCKPLCGCYEN